MLEESTKSSDKLSYVLEAKRVGVFFGTESKPEFNIYVGGATAVRSDYSHTANRETLKKLVELLRKSEVAIGSR